MSDDNIECCNCGWKGKESQLDKRVNDIDYPMSVWESICPKCREPDYYILEGDDNG